MSIPLSSPDITNLERKAVLEVLRTPILSSGPKTRGFEKEIALFAQRRYAVAVSSGTAALHLLMEALGIRERDEVIATPFSFIASANCILYERAKPVFVDIDEHTLTMDPSKIEKAITKRTKAILPVDVFGHPAHWEAIVEIARNHKLTIIEDSAEALGSEYKKKRCGSFGDAAIFSFYPNKQITTGGEGGAILTNHKSIALQCQSMRNQGRRAVNMQWFEHVRLGFNYRLTEMQCAVGLAQLRRLPEILEKRERVAQCYNERLRDVSQIELPFVAPSVKMSWFVYVIRLSQKYTRKQRDSLVDALKRKGIHCGIYFQPIHLQPFYRKLFGYRRGDFPAAERAGDRTVALPFYNNLREEEIDLVADTLKKAIHRFL
ncbi:MAG: DegT/DnrJ/EryC1/StrS family aminotransferase [Patescibacteria group bacterium]